MKQGDKVYYGGLDVLRGLAAFAVVVIHTPVAEGDPVKTSLLAVLPPANAVFAMMAGFLMVDGLTRAPVKFKDWMVGRARRLLVPYAVWTVVYVLLNVVFDAVRGQPSNFATTDWFFWGNVIFCGGGTIQLWFLIMLFYAQVLLFFSLVNPHVSPWIKKTVLMLIVVSAFACYPLAAPQGKTEGTTAAFLFMIGYCALGAQLAQLRVLDVGLHRRYVLGMVVLLCALTFIGFRRADAFSWGGYGLDILRALLWFVLALVMPLKSVHPSIKSMAKHSMGVYTFHVLFTTLLPVFMVLLGADVQSSYWTLLVAISAFLLSWAASALSARNPWLDVLLRGVPMPRTRCKGCE